jgi:CheY-like chemotaxis protein/HPt (histidine-containing phosphotransfer) domain-containing protein
MNEYDLLEGLKNYLDDIIEKLGGTETLILRLNTDKNKENQRKILQTLHSVKGTSGSYGLRGLKEVLHKMEDSFSILDAGGVSSEEAISDLLEQLDLVRQRIEEARLNPEKVIEELDKPEPMYKSSPKEQSISTTPSTVTSFLPEISDPTITTNLYPNTSRRVLILEDSQVVSKIILQTLNPYILTFSLVGDGYVALGRLLLEHFDVVVSQVRSKLIDGISLANFLQQIVTPNKQTPFIFVSGSGSANNIDVKSPNRYVIAKGLELPGQLISRLETLFPLEKKKSTDHFLSNLKSIAVIDDSEDIQNIVQISFDENQTKILCITDPATELQKLMGKTFDVILLDYQLGLISGVVVLRELRAIGNKSPVIFLTATEDPKEVEFLLRHDVSGIIHKPFIPRKLPQQIAETLAAYRNRAGQT